MEYISRDELIQRVAQNKAIEKGYAAFKKDHPYRTIVDIWSNCHFTYSIVEVGVKFIDYDRSIRTYWYVEEDGEIVKRGIR